MRKLRIGGVYLLLMLVLCALPAAAQFFNSPARRVIGAAALPAACQPNDIHLDTSPEIQLYLCTAANTWTEIASSISATFGTGTSRYPVDIYGVDTTAQQHISDIDADTGFYIQEYATDGGVDLSYNMVWNGTTYVAKATTAAQVTVAPTILAWVADTGLTPGNTFTSTVRFSLNGSGLNTKYGGVTTVGQGQPAIYGNVSLATQGGSIGTTNLYAAAPAGLYRVCWSQQITRAATTSSSLLTTIGWNNGGAKTATVASLNGGAYQVTADVSNGLNSEMGNCVSITQVAASNITYATTFATSGATSMQYALRVTAERIQ